MNVFIHLIIVVLKYVVFQKIKDIFTILNFVEVCDKKKV